VRPQPPANCDPVAVLETVSNQIEFPKQWMREAWDEHFMSPLSQCIMQDLYWWYFNDEFALILNMLGEDSYGASPIEASPQHLQAQSAMFNRISDCYTRMFWKVGLTMLTDDFFERYAEALADAVRRAFDTGLPDSKYLFVENDAERDGRLRALVVQWTTAIRPRHAAGAKGKSGKKIRCGKFNAVGHSPLMERYMQRHGCVAPIGGCAVQHNLQRLEVELREDRVRWRPRPNKNSRIARQSVKVDGDKPPARVKKPEGMPATSVVLPAITDTCGMGAFSQKKVDEVILGYLN